MNDELLSTVKKNLDNASLGHVEYMDWVANNPRTILEAFIRQQQIINGYKIRLQEIEEERYEEYLIRTGKV